MAPAGRIALAAIFGGILATVLLPASRASAAWQYTTWGMSPADVKSASAGAAIENRDRSLDADGLKAKLVAPYQGATLPFTAVFLFGIRDRLAVVTLNLKDPARCGGLPDLLKARYGPPIANKGIDRATITRWNDYADNNAVNFLDLGAGGCSIEYSRLLDTRNDGSL